MWPRTPEDMIDHLNAGYSTSLLVIIDTITTSGLESGFLTNPGLKTVCKWLEIIGQLIETRCSDISPTVRTKKTEKNSENQRKALRNRAIKT